MVTLENFKKVSVRLKPKPAGWGNAVFGAVTHHPNSWCTFKREYHRDQPNYEFRVCSLDNPRQGLFTISSTVSFLDLLCRISGSFDCIAQIIFRNNEGLETKEEIDLLELRDTFVNEKDINDLFN